MTPFSIALAPSAQKTSTLEGCLNIKIYINLNTLLIEKKSLIIKLGLGTVNVVESFLKYFI